MLLLAGTFTVTMSSATLAHSLLTWMQIIRNEASTNVPNDDGLTAADLPNAAEFIKRVQDEQAAETSDTPGVLLATMGLLLLDGCLSVG